MINLIGVPYDDNSSFLKGPAFAPARIRLMDVEGSANRYAENGLEVKEGVVYKDCGDMKFEGSNPEKAFQTIYWTMQSLLKEGNKVLSIGGDHSVSFPLIKAHAEQYEGLHILHLDAHADLYDNFDDNPYSHASPFARLMETGNIASLTQVGIRTFNTHQKEQADKFGVKVVEMKKFNMNFLHTLKGPLYISLDLDVLDPAFAPGISHHEPGGLSSRQLIHIIQNIPSNVDIIGADIVEYNPIRDLNNMTAMVGYKMMKEIMAKMG